MNVVQVLKIVGNRASINRRLLEIQTVNDMNKILNVDMKKGKQDTIYCRKFISFSDANIIQFKASWYEHTSKN